jgi:mono/diheme cytochrome c family protein
MRTKAIGAILLAVLFAATGSASAAEKAVRKIDLGKTEYESNCASCHGLTGKGDGTLKPYLTKSSTDLTLLAKQNGGVFPINRVYEVIDGRTDVKAHGGRDMPVWGRD